MMLFGHGAVAQNTDVPSGYIAVDSLVYVQVSRVDSSLVGKNIFNEMPRRSRGSSADVHIYQSETIRSAMDTHFVKNENKALSGYRVRIFFDNKQTARNESEAIVKKFEKMFPEVAAYRSYVNPYFKVTVGDFRTRSEAMQLLRRIKETFPAAFIVKEAIEYPIVDTEHAVRVDTVRVLRPVVETVR